MARSDSVASALAEIRALMALLPRLVSERVHLFTLELRQAGNTLGLMVALGIAAALMLATAWLALCAALVAGLVQLGLAWGWMVLLVAVLNIAGAVVLLLKLRSLVRKLALPATVRRLGVVAATAAAARNAPPPSSTLAAEAMASTAPLFPTTRR